MDKECISVPDFRDTCKQMIEYRMEHDCAVNTSSYLDTLRTLEEKSDEELCQSKLYADLGMDSLDVTQMITLIEANHKIFITDDAFADLGTGVSVTVEKFLDAINTNQEPEEV